MRRIVALIFATICIGAGVLVTTASGATVDTTSSLQLQARIPDKWQGATCPPGVAPNLVCYAFTGNTVVPGLGATSLSWTLESDQTNGLNCQYFDFSTATFSVAGKGEINVALTDPKTHCWVQPPSPLGPFNGTITGGTGVYSGATGTVQATFNLHETNYATGIGTEVWTGMIDAPGFTFDTTAPTFTRANNLTLRQHGHAKRMRVRYRLPTATDPGGDALQVACTPRSGSMFKTGTTIVHCAATDNNGNTATTTFAIAIKPSRR